MTSELENIILPVYGDFDAQRYVMEPPKAASRTPFERDRARILHSSGLRRLGTKTQVLGAGTDDFVRTRLTHSLEVSQVGRGIGAELGCDPDIVDAACLAHDLGHPPFGHNGERALNEAAADIGGFEGNAQTFRLVARLEPKVMAGEKPGGLNLTRATLDALTKYPWQRGQGPDPQKSEIKFGVYADDAPVFDWMRQEAPVGRRCLEAQIMDYSDDIAYSVHDLEDAVVTRRASLTAMSDPGRQSAIIDETVQWYGNAFSKEELQDAAARLTNLDYWPQNYTSSYRGNSAMKDLTSQLIGRFCAAATASTREEYGVGPLGRYRANLIVPRSILAEIQFLKGVAVSFVMSPRENDPLYYQQRTLILDLVDALYAAGPAELDGPFAEEWEHAQTDAARYRAVIDQVASLTDQSASAWHARLRGMLSTLL